MNTEVQSGNKTKPPTYIFYVVLDDGTNIEWDRLTERQARNMYAATNHCIPVNVRTYGWEEVK